MRTSPRPAPASPRPLSRAPHLVRLAFGAAFAAGCGASPPAAGPRTGATAAAELREYARFVRDVHPAPFRFVEASAFEARVEQEAGALEGSVAPTELEVVGAFRRVLAPLGDAHVAVTSGVFQPGAAGASFLPLLVADVEGALLIDAASDPRLVGAELVAVDGVPAAELRRRLEPLVVKDGVNPAATRRGLERDFTALFHATFGMAPSYRVAYGAGAGAAEVALAGAGRESVQALGAQRKSAPSRGAPAHDGAQSPFTLPPVEGAIWLRLPSFGSPDQAGYRAAIDAVMASATGAPALVVDLRGNEGGFRTHGIALLNHLLARPYRQWTRMTARVRELPEPYAGRATAAFGTDLGALRGFPPEPAGGQYVLEGDPLADRMVPSGAFAGRVLALADGRTNSAANELLVALKHARPDAILIGEEVGGACDEHVGELPTTWTTPTFGVSVLMSILRLEHVSVPGCRPGRGLAPDVAVRYSRADFDAGRDPYDAAVREALR
ncbi:MAG TPA: S41 family peptidase [Polyangiaceae bacterium]|nr:S41 family peptidase [Polyangiaceae bacterium]